MPPMQISSDKIDHTKVINQYKCYECAFDWYFRDRCVDCIKKISAVG